MIYSTAFREYAPDRVPSDWTSRWTAYTSNLVRHGIGDREPRLLTEVAASGLCGLSFDVVDSDTDRDDCQIRLRVSVLEENAAGVQPLAFCRGSGSAGSESFYGVGINTSTNVVTVFKYVTGAFTSLSSSAQGTEVGGVYDILFEVTGTTVRAKIWRPDEAEPTGWQASATDSSITAAGWVGIVNDDTADWVSYLYCSIATGGDEPDELNPPYRIRTGRVDFGSHPSQWVHEDPVSVEYVAGINSIVKSTGASDFFYASTHGRVFDASDIPASLVAHPTLRPVDVQLGISADYDHGQYDPETKIVLDNPPQEQGGAGIYDDKEVTNTSDGLGALIRVGKSTSKRWRSFATQHVGIIGGEPEFNGDEMVVTSMPTSRWLDRRFDNRRFYGIPTCLRQKTTGANGQITITHNSAYDLTSFTISACIRIEATGTLSRIALKQVSSTDENFFFYKTTTETFTLRYSVAGVSTNILVGTTAIAANRWYKVAVSVDAGNHAYLMIDGQVDIEALSPGTPNTQTASILSQGTTATGDQIMDLRLYGQYLTPDELRNELAYPDPVRYTAVGNWKVNDNTGSTVTDYSSTANNGSINGTINTDWEWYPTDLGDPELAGTLMPVAIGSLNNTHCPRIDSARERYRVSDRSLLSLFSVVTSPGDIYSKGVDVSASATYAAGVVSFSSAQDEPITALHDYTGASTTADGSDIANLVNNIVSTRGAFSISSLSINRLKAIYPLSAGWFSEGRELTVNESISEILKGCGCHYKVRGGQIEVDRLDPPIPDIPDFEPTESAFTSPGVVTTSVELMDTNIVEGPATHVIVEGADTFLTDVDIELWVYPMGPRNSQKTSSWTTVPPGSTLFRRGNLYIGVEWNSLRPYFYSSGITHSGSQTLRLTTPSGDDPAYLIPWTWNLIKAFISLDQKTIWAWAPSIEGSGNKLIGTTGVIDPSYTGSLSGTVMSIGDSSDEYPFHGAIGYIRTLNNTSPPSPTSAYILLTEGKYFPQATESGSSEEFIELRNARWNPIMTVDLTKEHGVSWGFYRQITASEKISVNYRKNYGRLGYQDLAASVSESERRRFMRPHLSATWTGDQISTEEKKEVALDCAQYTEAGAESVLSYGKERWGKPTQDPTASNPPGRVWGRLDFTEEWESRIIGLQRGDSVRVVDSRHSLSDGRNFRVVQQSKNSLLIWG